MIEDISAVLIVSNAEKTLDKCLESLKDFREVIVFINNSQDRSLEIAETFSNVKVFEDSDEFQGFGTCRNKAASFSSNDWIFSLDADEFINSELIHSLLSWNPNKDTSIGRFQRYNFYLGKIMRGGAYKPQYKNRLYHRKLSSWQGFVHEDLTKEKMSFIKLKGGIFHQETTHNIQKKRDFYSKLHNIENKNKPLLFCLLGSAYTFIKSYIIRYGFIDGWRGFKSSISAVQFYYSKNRYK